MIFLSYIVIAYIYIELKMSYIDKYSKAGLGRMDVQNLSCGSDPFVSFSLLNPALKYFPILNYFFFRASAGKNWENS